MRKGEIYEGVIEQFDFPNKGILRMDDRKVTIKGALPGQTVQFMVTKKKSGTADGKLLQVLTPSPMEDMEPPCPYFGACGGCAYQTMSYPNQLAFKESLVKRLLEPVLQKNGCTDYVWEGILASPETDGYRNKMEFTFGDSCKDGPLELGLHKKESFHDILTVSGCKIIDSDWSKILDYTVHFFRERRVPYFHRMRHEGILRTLVIRQSKANGDFLINLVTTTQWEKLGFGNPTCGEIVRAEGDDRRQENGRGNAVCDEIVRADGSDGHKESKLGNSVCDEILSDYVQGLLELEKTPDFQGHIRGILHTENDTLGDVVQCDRMVCLYGEAYIEEEILGLTFRISPFSFFQTNTKGCEVLYKKAREYIMSGSVMRGSEDAGGSAECDAEESRGSAEVGVGDCEKAGRADTNGKIVFDLYSGTGTIAQMMAPAAGKVIGIEIVEEAVEAARENASRNGLDNCTFIAGDVLTAIDDVEEKPDVIIVDPPRDGIHPKAMEKILNYGVQEVVYISCKPTSLARDLEYCLTHGYRVEKICCVDQFPRTTHVETVVLMSRQDT